jgi:imidazole glycerol-phosphate synthase subunit HisH
MRKKVGIVNYGMGNLQSVKNVLDHMSVESFLVEDEYVLKKTKYLILPGVGSFNKAMENLNNQNLVKGIREFVKNKKNKLLGICLGMQLMGKASKEDGNTSGLGLVEMSFNLFPVKKNFKVPHIGFNEVKIKTDKKRFFKGIKDMSDFYFNHSYMTKDNEKMDTEITCDHGTKFLAAFQKNNLYGSQFHPEKSQSNGLRLISNFLSD